MPHHIITGGKQPNDEEGASALLALMGGRGVKRKKRSRDGTQVRVRSTGWVIWAVMHAFPRTLTLVKTLTRNNVSTSILKSFPSCSARKSELVRTPVRPRRFPVVHYLRDHQRTPQMQPRTLLPPGLRTVTVTQESRSHMLTRRDSHPRPPMIVPGGKFPNNATLQNLQVRKALRPKRSAFARLTVSKRICSSSTWWRTACHQLPLRKLS